MIKITTGSMFNDKAVEVLINPVNCVGAMGKGLALAFKNHYPRMYEDYVTRCSNGEVKLGEPYLYRGENKLIINFPTKNHWKDKSYITDIENGLDYLISKLEEWNIDNIALPAIGCGLGGLNWDVVYILFEEKLSNLKQTFYVYLPLGKEAPIKYYTGVGARITPGDILELMEVAATALSRNYKLRSGGADGADDAFLSGALESNNFEVFLPWRGFNNNPTVDPNFIYNYDKELFDEASDIVRKVVPYFDKLKPSVQRLFTRNVFQVLGRDLKTPSNFLICWTEGGASKGGTRVAILVAQMYNVPVYNLANKEDYSKVLKLISES